MKRMCLGLIFIIAFTMANAKPIDTEISIRNTGFSYVNRGMCSVAFELVAFEYLENIDSIAFEFEVRDSNNKFIFSGAEQVDSGVFNMVGGKTYILFAVEGEEACKMHGENLFIKKAVVRYSDGTPKEDIVKTEKLFISDFTPMEIIIK